MKNDYKVVLDDLMHIFYRIKLLSKRASTGYSSENLVGGSPLVVHAGALLASWPQHPPATIDARGPTNRSREKICDTMCVKIILFSLMGIASCSGMILKIEVH